MSAKPKMIQTKLIDEIKLECSTTHLGHTKICPNDMNFMCNIMLHKLKGMLENQMEKLSDKLDLLITREHNSEDDKLVTDSDKEVDENGEHLTDETDEEDAIFVCHKCRRLFEEERAMESHIRSCTKKRPVDEEHLSNKRARKGKTEESEEPTPEVKKTNSVDACIIDDLEEELKEKEEMMQKEKKTFKMSSTTVSGKK